MILKRVFYECNGNDATSAACLCVLSSPGPGYTGASSFEPWHFSAPLFSLSPSKKQRQKRRESTWEGLQIRIRIFIFSLRRIFVQLWSLLLSRCLPAFCWTLRFNDTRWDGEMRFYSEYTYTHPASYVVLVFHTCWYCLTASFSCWMRLSSSASGRYPPGMT